MKKMSQAAAYKKMIQLWRQRDEARAKGDAEMLKEVEAELDKLTDS